VRKQVLAARGAIASLALRKPGAGQPCHPRRGWSPYVALATTIKGTWLMDLGLTGKRALVLGASRGLGAACARELELEGAEVYAVARSADNILAWAGDLPVTARAVDLTDPEAVAALGQDMAAKGHRHSDQQRWRTACECCNGAGSGWVGEAYQAMALHIVALTDALLPGMIERGFGRVLTIGSSGVISPIPNLALSNGVRAAMAG
jgi:3-oxoacyl-[acyl-carrier protein] reductase